MISLDPGIWLYFISFWAIMSFLIKYTVVFRYAEYTWMGVGAGYGCVAVVGLYKKMVLAPTVTSNVGAIASYGLATILGFFLFGRFSKKYAWTARIPTGIMIGVSLGVALIQTIQANLVSQISKSILPIATASLSENLINGACMIIVVSSLAYFVFTVPPSTGKGSFGILMKIGRYAVLISLGAAVGQLMLGRSSVLSGQLYKMLSDWLGIVK